MKTKNSLLIGRGIFLIIIIVAFGLIIVNEKGTVLLKNKVEKQLNTYLEDNYQEILSNTKKEETIIKNNLYSKKIVSNKNKNLYFLIKYQNKKISDTYKKDYVEGKTLFTYLNKKLEKDIKNKTKIDCKVDTITTLDKYSDKVQERIIKEDNLLELKYYYIQKELLIDNWNNKEITKEITKLIEEMKNGNITPKYYEITITNKDDITTSIKISNINEEFIENTKKEQIIQDIINNKETELLKENKITYKYEN